MINKMLLQYIVKQGKVELVLWFVVIYYILEYLRVVLKLWDIMVWWEQKTIKVLLYPHKYDMYYILKKQY